MTQTRKQWVRIGFWLIGLGFASPLLLVLVSFLMTFVKASAGLKCDDFTLEWKDLKLGMPVVFWVAGLLCILPVSEWITSWRKKD